ncbi:cell elongation-specific peptidoglycan biosynthesis regulator RodA [Desulfotomaculum arcticum]|uniref:Cell elongation-specific peptidoglycan biosynthesis regulator RodA n=1 Tax=Desulfotruncus arcticus DSM 17038 TaxID=1121424 RepID=A0A1I2R8J3_9FIRM|nr:FtsW/RodA/SpoVE family cell cycle protein [Desulfotruncus arcticus]SFG36848.1 cell elongation-specific peptidoglycan biosynthesis regulator RodA [Desulfotomaculum arcticum] [Desulfotruncus arcticus DSM 17038]
MQGRGRERALLFIAFIYTFTGGVVLYLREPGQYGLLAIAAAVVTFAALMLLSIIWQKKGVGFDQYITPLVSFLTGTGMVFLIRLQPAYGYRQLVWLIVGIAALFLTTTLVYNYRLLADYKYVIAVTGILALLLPIFFGIELGGAKSWLNLGVFHLQPSEFVKLLLVLFLGSYLVENRVLLHSGGDKKYFLPGLRQWGPLLGMWLVSLLVLVFQRDLGTALIYFATFLAMLYAATSRLVYVLAGTVMFSVGGVAAYMAVGHVHTRVAIWLNPWDSAQGAGYQLIQSLYAINAGGIVGTGLDAGFPRFIPAVHTDFIFSAICEETGLLGGIGILLVFILLVYRGFKIALASRDDYSEILAAGFTALLGLQVFIIVAGVTKLLPMTGITLPFISYGGSSLVANFILAGMLLNISGESWQHEK